MTPERIGAFLEYVIRPMTDDVRQILEKLKELNLPLSEQLIWKVGRSLAIVHLFSEIIRAITYIAITWLVCRTVLVAL